MSDEPQKSTVAELAMRWFDASASEAECDALWERLLTDPAAAEEFANVARFEAMLKQRAAAASKALLELAALSCEMDDADDLPQASPPQVPAIRRRGSFSHSWMKLAATLVILFGLATLICHFNDSYRAALTSNPHSGLSHLADASVGDAKSLTLLCPRPPARASLQGSSPTNAEPQDTASLPERLDNFFLPEVAFDHVPFADAARWLTQQLKEYNFLKRKDFDQLAIVVPPGTEKRLVTLHSGPISFFKAVQIVSRLALCDAAFNETGIALLDRVMSAPAPRWTPVPSLSASGQSLAGAKADAAALGLQVPDSAWNQDSGTGAVSVNASDSEVEAMRLLAESRKQLDDMAPLALMPVVLPHGAGGPDRVIGAAEVDDIRRQISQAPAGSARLPVIVLPRTKPSPARKPGTEKSSPLSGGSRPVFTITATPVGEMDRISIDPSTITAPQFHAPATEPPTSTPIYARSGTEDEGSTTTSGYADASGSTDTGIDGYIDDGMGLLVTVVGDLTYGMYMYAPDGWSMSAAAPEALGNDVEVPAEDSAVPLDGDSTSPGSLTILLLPVTGGGG